MVTRLFRHISKVIVGLQPTIPIHKAAGCKPAGTAKLHIALLLMSVLWLAACSSDAPFAELEPQLPDAPQDGTFTIFTRSEDTDTSDGYITFQDGKKVAYDKTNDNELINNWIVVFINRQSSQIAQIISDSEGTVIEKGSSYSFTPSLTDGNYDIVAFANMEDSEVKEMLFGQTSAELKNGESASLESIKSRTFSFEYKTAASKSEDTGASVDIGLIPMSGYRENVRIEKNNEVSSGDKGKRNTIEVIRMLAKVEIIFYNPTSTQVNIENIKFGKVQTNPEPLLPDYKALDDDEKAMPEAAITADNCGNVDINPTFKAVDPNGGTRRMVFYVRESDASKTNPEGGGFFMLSLKLILNENSSTANQHYAVTDQLRWIKRNDHIVIPVTIHDYYVNWTVRYYPPIGGYPAVVYDSRPSEFYYFCDFKTPGEFEIKPEIKDPKGNPIVTGYKLEVGNISDPDNIFKVQPRVSVNGDEIVGNVGEKFGDAVVPVTIKIESENSSTPITRTRNIYIRHSSITDTNPTD